MTSSKCWITDKRHADEVGCVKVQNTLRMVIEFSQKNETK